MLQNIRDNSQGWIAKTIIGGCVFVLALGSFDAIMQATHHENVAAKVNGDDISVAELQQAEEMQRRQLQQSLGKDFDASTLDEKLLKDAALKNLIERKLVLQAAQNDKFAFSQAQLDQLLLQTPEFQVDGKFNADRFDQYIRQMGNSRLQFRQMLEQEMLIGQLRAGIAGTGFVTDSELQGFARLEKQTRDFATLTFKAEPAKAKVEDADIKAYYEQHKSEFMSPEQVVIDYVQLKKSSFFDQVSVKQEDLEAAYQKEIAGLSEQRDAAHILIEVNGKQTDAQAKAKIEEIKARLDKGEDFAKLAKDQSNDTGSANNGGDLGYAGRGVYDPAFEQALYALKAKGDVSAPVRTQYGWHLIKLLGVEAPDVPTLASLKPKLEQDLKSQAVEQRFVDASKQLENSAYEAADLGQPAQEMGLKVETSKPFGREGGDGVTANRQVVQAAYSSEVLDDGANSSAIELDPDTVLVLRVKEHHKSTQESLEQATASIRERLQQEHAAADVKAKGEALLASLRKGTPVNQAYEGQAWTVVEAANRGQEGVEPQLLQAVFRMSRPVKADQPVFSGITLKNGDYALVRLSGVSEPSAALSDDEKAMYRRFLSSRSGQEDFAAFRRELQGKAEVEKY